MIGIDNVMPITLASPPPSPLHVDEEEQGSMLLAMLVSSTLTRGRSLEC